MRAARRAGRHGLLDLRKLLPQPLLEEGNRRGQISGKDQPIGAAETDIRPCLGALWIDLQRPLVRCYCRLQAALVMECRAQIDVGIGKVRPQRHSALAMRGRLIGASQSREDGAQVRMRGGGVRLEGQCLLVTRDRPIDLPLKRQRDAEIGVRFGKIRLQGQ
jgi:hypothetical protein